MEEEIGGSMELTSQSVYPNQWTQSSARDPVSKGKAMGCHDGWVGKGTCLQADFDPTTHKLEGTNQFSQIFFWSPLYDMHIWVQEQHTHSHDK